MSRYIARVYRDPNREGLPGPTIFTHELEMPFDLIPAFDRAWAEHRLLVGTAHGTGIEVWWETGGLCKRIYPDLDLSELRMAATKYAPGQRLKLTEWLYIEVPKCSISVNPRPHYCNRGNFMAVIDGPISMEVLQGWPRYYMDLGVAIRELESWMKKVGAWVDGAEWQVKEFT